MVNKVNSSQRINSFPVEETKGIIVLDKTLKSVNTGLKKVRILEKDGETIPGEASGIVPKLRSIFFVLMFSFEQRRKVCQRS